MMGYCGIGGPGLIIYLQMLMTSSRYFVLGGSWLPAGTLYCLGDAGRGEGSLKCPGGLD
jgi:hypothetical protein